jgi:molybdate transport system substrate-binding protein
MPYDFLIRLAGRRILLLSAALSTLFFSAGAVQAQADKSEMLIYCGITMVRPMTEIAQAFEKKETVKVTLAQGGSEDLYQSAKKSGVGDLYLPGEPTYRDKYLPEGLLGEFQTVGYNQMAIMVAKGNPHKVKGDARELLRKDLAVSIGNAISGSVGKETKDILDELKIYQKVVAAAVFLAPDSRGLNNALKKGEVDAVMNWRATGFFADNIGALEVIDLDPKLAKPQALLLNLLTFSKQKELARRFIAFSASAEGQAIFRKYGFLDNRTKL